MNSYMSSCMKILQNPIIVPIGIPQFMAFDEIMAEFVVFNHKP